jgi:hypothetical protein
VQNEVELKFVSSTGESDSLRAIVGSYFFSRIVSPGFTGEALSNPKISVLVRQDGLIICCEPTKGAIARFSVYNVIGQQMANFPQNGENNIYLSTAWGRVVPGLYLVKAELPDKTVLTRTFMFTR